MILKQGEKVMIYEDPFTEEQPEGVATLCEFLDVHSGPPITERWMVRFHGDSVKYQRTVKR